MKKEEKFAIEPIVEFDAVSDDELGAIVGGQACGNCFELEEYCPKKCDFCLCDYPNALCLIAT